MKKRVGSEAKHLYDSLAGRGVPFFELKEAMEACGKGYQATVSLIYDLVQAGWMVRVKRGRYGLTP